MPEMNGVTLVEQTRRQFSTMDPAIIMLSSMDGNDYKEKHRKLGISASLLKPINHSDLLDNILNVLAQAQAPESKAGSINGEASACFRNPWRILVAEDNAVNQLVARKLLEKLGHQIDIANNGREALKALKSNHYDMVFMDIQMPELDGLSTTRIIRKMEKANPHRSPIPIIAMTANVLKEDRERCSDSGMDDYISKPLNAGKLRDTLIRIQPRTDSRAGEGAGP